MRYPLKFYIKQTKTFLDFLENEKSPFFKLKLSNIASAKLLLPVFKMLLNRLNIYEGRKKRSLTIQPAFD